MKLSTPRLAASVLALAAVGAQAADLSFSAAAAAPGDYAAPVFTTPDATRAFAFTGSSGISMAPLGATGSYLSVQRGGEATVDLHGATSYTFLWGSPDTHNFIDVVTSGDDFSFGGADLAGLLGFTAGGLNANTSLFTITAAAGITLESIRFRAGGIAFELAEALTPVTAVPEPRTHALMLAGLSVLGFALRRRRGGRLADGRAGAAT